VQHADFTKDAPGKLVPVERDALAFVPDPAPETLALDPSALRLLTTAERALGQLTGTLRAMGPQVNLHIINRPLMRREAIASSRIEGTVATPEQLVLLEVEEASAPDHHVSDAQEVLNYMLALEHGFRRRSELPVSIRLMTELHATLMRGVRGDDERPGEIRIVQNFIGSTLDIRDARFVPPPVSALDACMRDLERYIHADDEAERLPHLVRLALVHYQFETIHPFRDGNGRVGRLLLPLILCEYDRLEQPSLYVSPYLERHRAAYTDLLLRVSQKGDFLAWVRFFLEAVAESARATIARAEALLALRREYHGRLSTARSSSLLLKLVDALFERPSLSIGAASKLLDVTPAAASANLQKLVEAKILIEVTGRKRDQRYVAREILLAAHAE